MEQLRRWIVTGTPWYKILTAAITQWRYSNQLKLKSLSDMCGVTGSYIALLRSGQRAFGTDKTMRPLCALIGLDYNALKILWFFGTLDAYVQRYLRIVLSEYNPQPDLLAARARYATETLCALSDEGVDEVLKFIDYVRVRELKDQAQPIDQEELIL